MARSLSSLADELAGQYADLEPAERADALADALAVLRPDADADSIEAAANRAAGYSPPRPERAGVGGGRSRRPASRRPPASRRQHSPRRGASRAGRRARHEASRAVGEVGGDAGVSSFGRVFRTGLYLTGLYWLLRSAGVVSQVTTLGRNDVDWLMNPTATIGTRQTTTATGPATAGRQRARATR